RDLPGFDPVRHDGLRAPAQQRQKIVHQAAVGGTARDDGFKDVGIADLARAPHRDLRFEAIHRGLHGGVGRRAGQVLLNFANGKRAARPEHFQDAQLEAGEARRPGAARLSTIHVWNTTTTDILRASEISKLNRAGCLAVAGYRGAGRGDTWRLEVVSKSRRQALRSCAVGLFLVSKPHARRSGKAGSPFLRPLLALSSVGRESSRGIEPRCGSRPPCVLANHPVSPLLESRSLARARRSEFRGPGPAILPRPAGQLGPCRQWLAWQHTITAKEAQIGNNRARALDDDSRNGVRGAVSAGLLGRDRRGVPALFPFRLSGGRRRRRRIPARLFADDGGAGVVGGADRRLHHLSLVSRGGACGRHRSRRVSAAPADVERLDQRLALDGHGVERTHRMADPHLGHHGLRRVLSLWPQPAQPAAIAQCDPRLPGGVVSGCGNRRLLGCDAEQERAGHRRRDHPPDARSVAMTPQNAAGPARSPNGAGAAAILAAGVGALALPVFAIAADKIAAIGRLMNFYQPTGPLSGVTTCAIAVWLIVWAVLGQRWRKRNLALTPILTTALILLGLGILLTFPPLADLF